MNGEKHTFICYARQDKEFARKLANGLRQNGVSVWMDVLDIPAGVRWDRAVEKALRKAERLLVILSPDAVASENVQDELAYAFDRKKPIVPARFRECEIPFRLLRLQYIDFTGDYDAALQELLASLGVEPVTHDPNAEEIERLFGEAQAEMANENWSAAIGSLKAVLALDASHAQANAALQQAEQEQELADLYARGREHFAAKRWSEAHTYFRKLLDVRGDYKNARTLLGQAERELVKAKKTTAKKLPADPVNLGASPETPADTRDNEAFERYKHAADSLFRAYKFSEAKAEYIKAQTYNSNNNYVSNQIRACDRWLADIAEKEKQGMALIPAGEFMMGSDDYDGEKPPHKVKLDAFYMDTTEVTVVHYKRFLDANPSHREPSYWQEQLQNQQRPVVNVSWHDAKDYADWANKKLPTEAQWEYAARGGLEGKKYPWGDAIDRSKANYGNPWSSNWSEGPGKYLKNVGSYQPNSYSLYDMSGNVWEWCQDKWHDNYKGAPTDGSAWETGESSLRVLRGGSWSYDPDGMRCADRNWSSPGYGDNNIGFRCVQDVTL